jgi:hypothetical protein
MRLGKGILLLIVFIFCSCAQSKDNVKKEQPRQLLIGQKRILETKGELPQWMHKGTGIQERNGKKYFCTVSWHESKTLEGAREGAFLSVPSLLLLEFRGQTMRILEEHWKELPDFTKEDQDKILDSIDGMDLMQEELVIPFVELERQDLARNYWRKLEEVKLLDMRTTGYGKAFYQYYFQVGVDYEILVRIRDRRFANLASQGLSLVKIKGLINGFKQWDN